MIPEKMAASEYCKMNGWCIVGEFVKTGAGLILEMLPDACGSESGFSSCGKMIDAKPMD